MDLALKSIEEHGTEKLSLRALAREAGVSPTAPYRHFSSKQCLLAAIATQGFHTLRERRQANVDWQLPVEERTVAMALSYVDFAIKNPTAYRLMFGSVLGDFSEFQMLEQAVTAAYEDVDKLLTEIIEHPSLDADSAQLGGVVWSFLHGLSSLIINDVLVGQVDSKPKRAVSALRADYEAALRLMFDRLFTVQPD
jgi:AcrR family transcriptional regulator